MKVEDALKNSILAGIFLLPLIPLIVADSMAFPFITGKNFSFRILVEILFALWVVLALLDARYRPRFSYILVSLLGLTSWMFFANLFSENVFKSFLSNFERMDGWLLLLHILMYAVVAVSMLTRERLWWWFWHISILIATVIGIMGLADVWQYLTTGVGDTRVYATLGNPIYLAVYALFHVFIAGVYMARASREWYILLGYGSFISLQVLLVYFSATRGTTLGLLAGAFVSALLLSFLSERKGIRILGAGLLASVVLLVGGFFLAKDSSFVRESPVLSRFASISLEDNTTKARLMVWEMAYQGFTERPALGWGQESFNYVFNKHYNPNMYAQEQWFDRAHNVYLDWLIAGGLPALLLYLSLYFTALYYLWFYRRDDELFSNTDRALLTGLLVAYGFHNLFVFDILVSLFFFISVLLFIHTRATEDMDTLMEGLHIKRATVVGMGAPVVVALCFVFMYFINIPGIQNAKAVIHAEIAFAEGDFAKARELYERAYARNHIGRQEVAEQSIQSGYRAVTSERLSENEKREFVVLARSLMEREIAHSPNDARPYLFLGSFLSNVGMAEEGREYLEEALRLSPGKQTLLFELGLNAINRSEYQEALGYLEEAFVSAPEFDRARILFAVGLLFAGERARADGVLIEGFETTIVDDENLLRAYAQLGFWEDAIAIQEARVESNPSNIDTRLQLAATYLESGNRAEALRVMREAKRDFPNLEEDLERIIQSVESGV